MKFTCETGKHEWIRYESFPSKFVYFKCDVCEEIDDKHDVIPLMTHCGEEPKRVGSKEWDELKKYYG